MRKSALQLNSFVLSIYVLVQDWECSKRDGGRKEKMVYYLKGTLPAKTNAAGGASGLTISTGNGGSVDKSSAGVPSQAVTGGSPRMTPGSGGGGGSSKSLVSSAGGSSSSQKASAKTAPVPLPTGVPHFGGSEGHRSYFHAEALERGLRRANATLAKLGESTGELLDRNLHCVFFFFLKTLEP